MKLKVWRVSSLSFLFFNALGLTFGQIEKTKKYFEDYFEGGVSVLAILKNSRWTGVGTFNTLHSCYRIISTGFVEENR